MKIKEAVDVHGFDVTQYVIEKLLEVKMNGSFRKLVVRYISQSAISDDLGRIMSVDICENEIYTQKDDEKWQMRISVEFDRPNRFLYIDPKTWEVLYTPEQFIDILIDRIRAGKYKALGLCVKLYKSLGQNRYIAQLFDDYFIVKSQYTFRYEIDKRFKHEWIVFERDLSPNGFESNVELTKVSKERAMVEVVKNEI